MNERNYSRRMFLIRALGLAAITAGTGVILSSCNSGNTAKDENNAPLKNCDDLSHVSQSEIEKRKKAGYVNESYVPGHHCGNCALYVPPDTNQKCGACLLFKGPVRPTGYCAQYSAKT